MNEAIEEMNKIVTAAELMERNPVLNEPVVEGLLRRGEIANIVAAPKAGKTWLALNLALAVQTGGEWLGFKCHRGDVLYDDLELHPSVSAHRLPLVANAMGLDPGDWAGLRVCNERGFLRGIAGLEDRVEELQGLGLSLIVVDAWYRALPPDCDENSNGDVMQVYNRLDALAADIGCAFVLVHHTTKGVAANAVRATTDLGAGAGSQSRAADAHLAIRPLKMADCFGVSAAVRSWGPVAPFAVRREFPLFVRDDDLDPTDYEGKKSSPKVKAEELAKMVPQMIRRAEPKTQGEFAVEVAEKLAVSERKARDAIHEAERLGLVKLVRLPGQPLEKRAAKFVLPA